MKFRKIAASIVVLFLIFGLSFAATAPAQADEPATTPYTMTCEDGHGLRQVAIDPVPQEEVQIFDKEAGGFIRELDEGGSVTLPISEFDSVKTIQLWGVTSKRSLVEMASKDCVPELQIDVYITPGEHFVNGRNWRTTCEPYSQTERCRTEIWATQVNQVNGKFIPKNGWVFNNLTYKASPRSLWEGNPLGELGSWTSADGREWMTDCDSAETGRNGCRSYILADVIEVVGTPTPGEPWRYGWTTKFVFNNMVRFS